MGKKEFVIFAHVRSKNNRINGEGFKGPERPREDLGKSYYIKFNITGDANAASPSGTRDWQKLSQTQRIRGLEGPADRENWYCAKKG